MNTETLQDIIQAMLQPSFHGLKANKSIKLIQTHISYVINTGTITYKIKKGLNLSFLDFTTLESRKHFCEEELRLNKKYSPDIYLGVIPIYKNNHKYSFTELDNSVICEYAIKMNSFDDRQLFSVLSKRGELLPDHLEQVGETLAKHHKENAATNEYIDTFGEIKNIEGILDGNFSLVQKQIGSTISQTDFDEIKNHTFQYLHTHAALVKKRQSQHFFKECHGDLHLKNIFLHHGKAQIFDCIEFNEQFKYIDTMYDATFLYMDLIANKEDKLANVFINKYLEVSGDYEGAILLPMYASMRSFIRGKVISLETNDPSVSAEQKEKAQKESQRYFQLAKNLIQPEKGKVYIMSGVSGSGKSYLGGQIANNIAAIHLRTDAIRKHLLNIPLTSQAQYDDETSARTYSTMLQLSQNLYTVGFNLVLDGTFLKDSYRNLFQNTFEKEGIPYSFIHCYAPEHILRERIKNRVNDVSDADTSVLESQLENSSSTEDAICVDTSQEVDISSLL